MAVVVVVMAMVSGAVMDGGVHGSALGALVLPFRAILQHGSLEKVAVGGSILGCSMQLCLAHLCLHLALDRACLGALLGAVMVMVTPHDFENDEL